MMEFLCSVQLVASLMGGCAPPPPLATGYVEGEFTLVAPVEVAQIREVEVVRGDHAGAGQVLVRMEKRDAEIALAGTEAQLAQAKGHLADLLEGARSEEIDVIVATLASAKAQKAEAERARDRLVSLSERGVATDSERDDAITAADVAAAKVAEVEAQLAVARLPPRPQAVEQARAEVTVASAARDRAEWILQQRTLSLPIPVTVVDVIRSAGEIAGPAAPVLSVLGEGAVKLWVYVPEQSVSQIAVGDMLAVGCDGCPPDLRARISYISDEPEFTPPVIYSLENRQKLVYLVEARPENDGMLKPGQIVDVHLPEAEAAK
jgi:HlyD family secretion protein